MRRRGLPRVVRIGFGFQNDLFKTRDAQLYKNKRHIQMRKFKTDDTRESTSLFHTETEFILAHGENVFSSVFKITNLTHTQKMRERA